MEIYIATLLGMFLVLIISGIESEIDYKKYKKLLKEGEKNGRRNY